MATINKVLQNLWFALAVASVIASIANPFNLIFGAISAIMYKLNK